MTIERGREYKASPKSFQDTHRGRIPNVPFHDRPVMYEIHDAAFLRADYEVSELTMGRSARQWRV